MPSPGCGTCRARKVRCDQTLPTCNRCLKAGRHCKGYGMRLSWPRRNDTRRAIVGPAPRQARLAVVQSEPQLVNTSSRDIKLNDLVSDSTFTYDGALQGTAKAIAQVLDDARAAQASQTPTALLKSPKPWAALQLSPIEMDLFQYFVHKASYSITSFGHDALRTRDVLIRMAVSDITLSSTAVTKSALALASFHRDNASYSAGRLKGAALRMLSDSTRGSISITDSACHIAAGMIFCTLEIQQNSMKSNHWLWYLCGCARMIKLTGLDEIERDEDLTVLIGWAHYCNVISRFSLRHWQPDFPINYGDNVDIDSVSFHPAVCSYGEPDNLIGPPHEILYLLSEVLNGVVSPSDPSFNTEAYRSHLQILDWKLRNIGKGAKDSKTSTDTANPDFKMVTELYRLATLIYLRRASAGTLPTNRTFVEWIEKAFALLVQLPAFQWPFPLLIFGCEARTDKQRMVILDLMRRTMGNTEFRNIQTVKRVIETIWVQNDLSSTDDLDYIRKLGVILSSTHKTVPSFL
ncbi:hypothetical protein FSARC_859 [Fusarium sarcochroum]|uniref:Zn(2)-C6 fungal-type domain-containing protein n=1 Tax=Fusarium sarcochroum TaxID=1208366 RepID=A0A8H4XFR8_9HYPO|nr:hypothetical protein FSARC_859 [Fusarium sarcochroum]